MGRRSLLGMTSAGFAMAVNVSPSKSRKTERKGPMNRRTIKISQVAAAILSLWLSVPCAPLTAQTKDTGTLTVRVTGARNTKGKIGITLFQDAQGFPDDTSKAVRQQSVDIDPNTMSAQVAFKDLPQAPSLSRSFTTKTATESWTRTLSECPRKATALPTTPRRKGVRRRSTRRNFL
jgi:hypothetical protein